MWNQLVSPRDDVESNAGLCLWFQQEVWQVPHQFPTAWQAWQATQFKHEDRNLPDVCVPVWFDHWGTYGNPPTYGQYGHVVTYFPSRGFLSSPGRGYGQQWFGTIEEVERTFNAPFVGWSEDMQPGMQVVEFVEEVEDMAQGAFYRNPAGKIVWQEKPNTVLIPLDFTTWVAYATNGNKYADVDDAAFNALIKKYGTADVPSAGGGTVNVPDFKISMSGEAVKK